jgi:hypothetical protein
MIEFKLHFFRAPFVHNKQYGDKFCSLWMARYDSGAQNETRVYIADNKQILRVRGNGIRYLSSRIKHVNHGAKIGSSKTV